jgi:hypothetical protein
VVYEGTFSVATLGLTRGVRQKKVETRCWTTKYRGQIAIHSTSTIPGWLGNTRKSEDFHDRLMEIMRVRGIEELVKGCILLELLDRAIRFLKRETN